MKNVEKDMLKNIKKLSLTKLKALNKMFDKAEKRRLH